MAVALLFFDRFRFQRLNLPILPLLVFLVARALVQVMLFLSDVARFQFLRNHRLEAHRPDFMLDFFHRAEIVQNVRLKDFALLFNRVFTRFLRRLLDFQFLDDFGQSLLDVPDFLLARLLLRVDLADI